MAYNPRHIAKVKQWQLYDTKDDLWYGLKAIRLPFTPEMWLVALHEHSLDHCGVAVKLEKDWFLNAGDAGAMYNNTSPAWLIKLVLGPHDPILRQFFVDHPDVVEANSHMAQNGSRAKSGNELNVCQRSPHLSTI